MKTIEYNELGFDLAAPVFGQEYKSQPDTLREKNTKALAALAVSDGAAEVPYGKTV